MAYFWNDLGQNGGSQSKRTLNTAPSRDVLACTSTELTTGEGSRRELKKEDRTLR